jgi:hypothetical protein
MLLRFKPVHVDWQLRRSNNVGKVNELPARELSPVAQIEVLTQRIMLPSATLLDA